MNWYCASATRFALGGAAACSAVRIGSLIIYGSGSAIAPAGKSAATIVVRVNLIARSKRYRSPGGGRTCSPAVAIDLISPSRRSAAAGLLAPAPAASRTASVIRHGRHVARSLMITAHGACAAESGIRRAIELSSRSQSADESRFDEGAIASSG